MSSGAALGAALSPAQRTQARFALLLWPLLVTCFCCFHSAWAQELPTNGVHGYSLHPPYFNLAESTKITATATCGEDDTGRSVQDLYCKLVGGPVSGDPSQTIQVSGAGGKHFRKVLSIRAILLLNTESDTLLDPKFGFS